MKPRELMELRKRIGLDRLQFARLIGYTGTDRNDEMRVRRLETGTDVVPLYIARLGHLIENYQIAFGRLPIFPRWPGYDFSHEPDPQHQKERSDG